MCVQVKKNNTQSAQSARSAQSAVCSLHGLRFNMTGIWYTINQKKQLHKPELARASPNKIKHVEGKSRT